MRKRTKERPVDVYGYPSRLDRRHPLCRCKVPCAQRFTCTSVHHVGRRSTPWCNGCADDFEIRTGQETCDECWAKHHPARAA